MVDAVLRLEGLKGLVLETFGAGNTPGGPDSAMTRCLADAVKRGIVIVNVTQCLSGSVSALYAPGAFLGRAGVVFGQDLTSEAALTKLAYLLALPDATPEEVAKRMSVSLRGELTETTRTHFEHPSRSGVLTPELSSLTALGYAVQKGDLQATKDIIRGEPRWLLNDADYQMNSPVVSAFPSSQQSETGNAYIIIKIKMREAVGIRGTEPNSSQPCTSGAARRSRLSFSPSLHCIRFWSDFIPSARDCVPC
jgi:lysophospholipase